MKTAIVGTVLLFIGLTALLVHLVNEDEKKWDAFKTEHHCQVVAKIKGQPTIGYTSSGKGGIVVVQEPDKTGYLCDDGVTYYR